MRQPKIAGFEFAEGVRFQPGHHPDPNVVGTHIEMLRRKFKGELTPKDILADARHDNSPLNSFFEWDNSEAAEQYRLNQARGLIRAVVAIYVSPNKPEVRRRAYIHVPDSSSPHYRETTDALAHNDTRQLVLARAMNELKQWRTRYKDLEEFAEFVKIIDVIDTDFPKPLERV